MSLKKGDWVVVSSGEEGSPLNPGLGGVLEVSLLLQTYFGLSPDEVSDTIDRMVAGEKVELQLVRDEDE